MNKKLMTIFLMSLIVLFQCDKNNITQPIDTNYGENIFGSIAVSETDMELMTNDNLKKGNDVNLIAWEVRLKYFAKGIAKLLNDPEIGAYLKEEIGKQFDGDYDALWETLADQEFAKKGKFKNILRKLYNTNIDMIDQFNTVPLLQVSAPIHFDKWDVSEPLLVAYNPITIDDMECEEIVVFDGKGNKFRLNAKDDPEFPVMVIGLNERVNPATKEVYNFTNNSAGKIASTTKDLRIGYVRLVNDKEPWWKGSPEIYYQFINNSTDFRKNYYSWWKNSGSNNYWRHFNKRIMYWHSDTDAQRSIIRWMEHDTGKWPVTLSLSYSFEVSKILTKTVKVDFNIHDKDDNMGSATFHIDDPTSSKDNYYSTGDVKFTIYWNNI